MRHLARSFYLPCVRFVHIPRPEPHASDELLYTPDAPETNMCEAINSAIDIGLSENPRSCTFGEDVAFGGVFRCTVGLREKHGTSRVFNSVLSEQGLVGFGIGLALSGWKTIAEVQFADYIFPAYDQIINEAAKVRYRSGNLEDCGGLVIRSPSGGVGHGGHYHSQSVEGHFTHTPGLKIVIPSTPAEAKGLLLQCIDEPDPCLFFEPKILYRTAVEPVNPAGFRIPLGRARTVRRGSDLTVVTYGNQVNVAIEAAEELSTAHGVEAEVIDLRSIIPWDREHVVDSVLRTRRVMITHEAPVTSGFGAEVASTLALDCFLHLDAPPMRVCGLDTPVPLHETLFMPNKLKLIEKAKELVKY